MNLLHKCVLAGVILLLGAGASRATGVPKPGAESSAPPVFLTSTFQSQDTTVKAVPGYVRYMVCIGEDNSATAGTIALLDHTTTGGGTTVVSWAVQTTYNYATPVIFPVEREFTAGIVIDYTNADDIACYVVYR